MKEPNFDRLLEVLWREEPSDRIPFFEVLADLEVMETITNIPMRNLDLKKEKDAKKYLDGLIKFYIGLGYDYVLLTLGLNIARENVKRTKEYNVKGSLSRGWRGFANQYEGSIKTMDDFESYVWPDEDKVINCDTLEIWIKELRKREIKAVFRTIGVHEFTYYMMGFVNLAKAIYREPELAQKMFDKIGGLIYSVHRRFVEEDVIGAVNICDDMAYNKGTMIPPKFLRKWVFPWQKRLVEVAHKHGKPFTLHTCGDIEAVMDDLINYVRIDARHGFQDNIMPAAEWKKKWNNKIATLGGVDMDKICRYSENDFQRYVREVIRENAPSGCFALGTGNTVANYINLENYLTMLKEGQKTGRYTNR